MYVKIKLFLWTPSGINWSGAMVPLLLDLGAESVRGGELYGVSPVPIECEAG
jgi:hypothetical protein